jgi:hypothetical protein
MSFWLHDEDKIRSASTQKLIYYGRPREENGWSQEEEDEVLRPIGKRDVTWKDHTYKSKVAGLEDNIFDVGAASNPARFSKLLENIEN